MYLVAGLGNPGLHYRHTRHNLGFMVLDLLAEKHQADFGRMKAGALISQVEIGNRQVLLAKPQTMMNASGSSIRELLSLTPVDLSQVLIVYDEAALPLGTIRLRPSGSAGGQKGMRSIIEHLGTEQIPRLRVGIRGEAYRGELTSYVLSRFGKQETELLPQILKEAASAVETFVTEGIQQAMALHNSKGPHSEVDSEGG